MLERFLIATIAGTATLALLLPLFVKDTMLNAYRNRQRIAALLAEIGGCLV